MADKTMGDDEFCNYMLAAAADRTLVSGEDVDRLRRLSGASTDQAMPVNWWGTVSLGHVEWAAERARRKITG